MTPIYTFYSLKGKSQGTYQESGSKFLAYAFPSESREEVEVKLVHLKSLHPKARHLCCAYRLLEQHEITEYASDAGEPSGSAGPPILNALRSAGLVNAGVVVVRYFGGTRLGIPGLIHAYRESATLALQAGEQMLVHRQHHYTLDMPLQLQPMFFYATKQLNIAVGSVHYAERFSAQISIPMEDADTYFARMLALMAGREGSSVALAAWLDVHVQTKDTRRSD